MAAAGEPVTVERLPSDSVERGNFCEDGVDRIPDEEVVDDAADVDSLVVVTLDLAALIDEELDLGDNFEVEAFGLEEELPVFLRRRRLRSVGASSEEEDEESLL